MKKRSISLKHKLYIVLTLTMILLLSGCGLPREHNFNLEKDFYNKNKSKINELLNFIESNNFNNIYKNYKDKKYYYNISGTEEKLLLSNQYSNIEQIVIELDISNIGKRGKDDGDIFLETYNNGSFFKSYKDIKDIECPFKFVESKDNLKKLKLKKEIEGNKIHFIADHRKEKETVWKGMYYRIDVEKIDTYIYSYEFQRKFPWYSIFTS